MYVVTIIMCLCHATLLNSDSPMKTDSRLVEICQNSLFLLRAYSVGIESTLHCNPPSRVSQGVVHVIYHYNENNYANTIHPKLSLFPPRP